MVSRMPRVDSSTHATRAAKTATADIGAPASTLPRFNVKKFWDADSTPPALACVSRSVGSWLPNSGARTPKVEAAVVLASLMHDVSYYYGGWQDQKSAADSLFGKQIVAFAGVFGPETKNAARTTAAIDQAAVALGGGVPFEQSFSWSYGFAQSERGFASLNPGEQEKIRSIGQQTFKTVINQIAEGKFKPSDVLKGKLAKADPAYQQEIKDSLVTLAKALQKQLKTDPSKVPGFE